MFLNITYIYNNHRTLIKNFSFLSILQFVQLAVTFIVYPYLIKILGQEKYGIIAYAQAIVGYLTIVINYGFNATATKQIAIKKENIEEVNNIFNAVLFAKMYLFLISFIAIILGVSFIPFLSHYKWIYLGTFLSTIGWVLFPDWYFQGIERMQNITHAMVISKILSVMAIFLFVKNDLQFLYVPLINSLGMIIAGLIGIALVLKSNKKLNFHIPKFVAVKEQYKLGLAYFISNISANTKDYFNTIIIGIFFNYSCVAIYDLANRIIKMLILPCSIFASAVFPVVAIKRSVYFNLRIEKFMLVYTILICIILFIIPDSFWFFVKENLEDFKICLYILSLSLPLLALTTSRGFLTLVAFNKDTFFTRSILFSIIGYFLFIGMLILYGKFNLYTAVSSIIFSLIIEVIMHTYGMRKNNLHA